jgi:hypothetical protein
LGAEQLLFKDAKLIREELSGARNRQKPLGLFCAFVNSYCLAQDRRIEPKLVWLEPSGHENSDYVRNNFLVICEGSCNAKSPNTSEKICVMKQAFVFCQGSWQVRHLPGLLLCYFSEKIKSPDRWIMSVWHISGSQPVRNM